MSEEKSENNLISLSQASEITGYNQDYLGFLARTGKLQAQKIGRNWVTSISAVNSLLGNNSEAGTKTSGAVRESGAQLPLAVPTQEVPVALSREDFFIVPPKLKVSAEPLPPAAPEGFAESNLLAVKQAAQAEQRVSDEQHEAAMRASIAAGVASKLENFQKDFKAELGAVVGTVVAEKTAERFAADAARAAAIEQAAQQEAAQAAKEKSNVAFRNASGAVEVLPLAAGVAAARSLDTAKIYKSFQKNLSAQQVRYGIAGAAASVAIVALAIFFGYRTLNTGIQKQFASLPVRTQQLVAVQPEPQQPQTEQPQKIVYIQGSQTVKYVQGPGRRSCRRVCPGQQGPAGAAGSPAQAGVFNPSNGLIASPYAPSGNTANVPVSPNSGPQTIFSSGQGSFNSVTTNDLTANDLTASTASLQSASIPSLNAGTENVSGAAIFSRSCGVHRFCHRAT